MIKYIKFHGRNFSFADSKIYAKPDEVDVVDELADSLQQMQKDAMTIKEESLSQFKSIGQGEYLAIRIYPVIS